MVRTASWTVAVSPRHSGWAGARTAMVSFRSASLLSRRSSVFVSDSSIVAEYSSSNSPLMTAPSNLILTPQSDPGNGRARQWRSPNTSGVCGRARRLFAGVPQELDEPAHRRRQRLLPAMDQADRSHEIGDRHRDDGERTD